MSPNPSDHPSPSTRSQAIACPRSGPSRLDEAATGFQRLRCLLPACLVSLTLSQDLRASCMPPPTIKETFVVLSCSAVDTAGLRPPPNWLGLHSYQGVILEIEPLPREKNSAPGQPGRAIALPPGKRRVFYHTSQVEPCAGLVTGTRNEGTRTSACCDGDPNPPCLLGISEFVYDLKKVGPQVTKPDQTVATSGG